MIGKLRILSLLIASAISSEIQSSVNFENNLQNSNEFISDEQIIENKEIFFLRRKNSPKVKQNTDLKSPFCVAGANRLKAGPENLNLTLSSNQTYVDPLYSGRNMVYWQGDKLTTPNYEYEEYFIDNGFAKFKGW